MVVYVFGSTRCRLSSCVWHLGLSGKDERHTGVDFRKILFYIPERAFGKPNFKNEWLNRAENSCSVVYL